MNPDAELTPGDKYWLKVKHTLPVFACILAGSIAGLMLVRWLVSVRFDILDLKEDIWSFWIPLFFPVIPIAIWLRPRLTRLVEKSDVPTVQVRFQFLAWGLVSIPLIVSQYYFNSAAGSMVRLNSVKDLNGQRQAMYYTIEDFEVIPASGGYSEVLSAAGRNNEYLDIDIYFAAPVISKSDNMTSTSNLWYGLHYHHEISNRLKEEEKNKQYKAFYDECIQKTASYNFQDLSYFRRLPNSDDKNGFIAAINKIDLTRSEHALILEPSRESFEDRNGNTLLWLMATMVIGALVFLIALRARM